MSKFKPNMPPRVLIVEDNIADSVLIGHALQDGSASVQFETATSVHDAFRRIADARFDLIILDFDVPQGDGHTILQHSRAGGGPPVVIFSGSQNPIHKEQALALGAKEFILKPARFDAFIRTVQDIVERHASFNQERDDTKHG